MEEEEEVCCGVSSRCLNSVVLGSMDRTLRACRSEDVTSRRVVLLGKLRDRVNGRMVKVIRAKTDQNKGLNCAISVRVGGRESKSRRRRGTLVGALMGRDTH